jgi:hypothetical protein
MCQRGFPKPHALPATDALQVLQINLLCALMHCSVLLQAPHDRRHSSRQCTHPTLAMGQTASKPSRVSSEHKNRQQDSHNLPCTSCRRGCLTLQGCATIENLSVDNAHTNIFVLNTTYRKYTAIASLWLQPFNAPGQHNFSKEPQTNGTNSSATVPAVTATVNHTQQQRAQKQMTNALTHADKHTSSQTSRCFNQRVHNVSSATHTSNHNMQTNACHSSCAGFVSPPHSRRSATAELCENHTKRCQLQVCVHQQVHSCSHLLPPHAPRMPITRHAPNTLLTLAQMYTMSDLPCFDKMIVYDTKQQR